MGVESVIDTFVTHPSLQIKRVARGVYVDERYEDGDPTYFRVVASVRPDSGADLQNPPEGQSEIETRVVFTKTELWGRTRDTPSATGHDPDLIILGIGTVPAAAAELFLGDDTDDIDTTIAAIMDGIDGNALTIQTRAAAVGATGVLDESGYPAILFSFLTGVTTVGDFEAAVTASDSLVVTSASLSPTSVLVAGGDEIETTALAGGFGEEWRVTRAKQYRTFWKVWVERLDKP